MKGLEFPIIGTKVEGINKRFDLNSPAGRKDYFLAKAKDEIFKIRDFLKKNNFMAFLVGKKNSGKGTYAKLFAEIFGSSNVVHLSVGDLVREVHANWGEFKKTEDFKKLRGLYRGYISFEEAEESLLSRTTEKLLPTEFILALLKLKISKLGKKSIFIDGLPREKDQVSYSLYFRDLAGYTDALDFFVLIDIPESVIDERIKYRVVCPKCFTSRNEKLLLTSKIEYDKNQKKFYLICDNPECTGKERMIPKEGDELGIEAIKERLEKDEEILRKAFSLYGIPKVLLRNHVPVKKALYYFDEYEITSSYEFLWDKRKEKVIVKEKPWIVRDDNGVDCYSLLPAPVVVSMLKQMADILSG